VKTEKRKKGGAPKGRQLTPLLLRQATALFPDEAERNVFTQALIDGISREKAIILLQDRPEIKTFPRLRAVDWQPDWVMRLEEDFRPGQHPLYAKGAFYSLDFSSVFSASAMLAVGEAPKRVLDLCASPGGKSVFAWRAFQPELLYANEVIRKRIGTLVDNFQRCQLTNSVVWSADPSVYAKEFREEFDLVIVDAPCSGQSLLAKGDSAPGCFAPTMIDMNHSRQRRITGNAVHCVRPGGHMAYMTCTYSHKENERIVEWLTLVYPKLRAVEIPHLREFRSQYSEVPCYRLFPQSGLGAGAFVCLLYKEGEPTVTPRPADAYPFSWRFGANP